MRIFIVKCVREFLSRAKNSDNRSSEARRSSLRLSFLPNAPEAVSVSSRAITTTGTGVAFFAVLGLKTMVLINWKDFGEDVSADNASFQDAGEFVALWETAAVGLIERAISAWVT